jgi:hypothetical protein
MTHQPETSLRMGEMRLGLHPDPWVDFQFTRFLGYANAGAATLGEVLTLARRVDPADLESWYTAWRGMAERVRPEAEALLRAGAGVDARGALLRALYYHHASEQFLPHRDPRRREVAARVRECFLAACKATGQPVTPLRFASRGTALPAYFLPAAGPGPRPTLLVLGGGDSCVEELALLCGFAAVERGWHAFLFEVPGQTTSLTMNDAAHFAPDTEVPFAAAVDLALAQPGVDPHRLSCVAISIGGYLGTRAAAHEQRVRAWAFDASLHDLRHIATSVAGVGQMLAAGASLEAVDAHMEKLRGHPAVDFGFDWFSARFRPVTRWSEIIRHLDAFVVPDAMLARITAPVAVICGANEPPDWVRLSKELVAKVGGPATLDLLEPGTGADDHVSCANYPAMHAALFGRLAAMLPR